MDIDGLAAAYMVEKLLDARLKRTFPIPQPAAGADWAVVVPGGLTWELLAVHGSLAASVVVASRRPNIVLIGADGFLARYATSTAAAAGSTWNFSWAAGLGGGVSAGGADASNPLSDPIPLFGGDTITSLTRGIDVADQWLNVTITVRELSPDRVAEQVRRLENDVAGLFGRFDFEDADR